jgi:hypothetical protein
MEDKNMGSTAKMWTQFSELITPVLELRDTALILIAQMRMQIGLKFGNPETMSGGKALSHMSSLTLKFTSKAGTMYTPENAKRESAGDKEKPSGEGLATKLIGATVTKTRITGAPEGATTELVLRKQPQVMFDMVPQLIDAGARLGILCDKEGRKPFGAVNWFFRDGDGEMTLLGNGGKNADAKLRSDPQVATAVHAAIYAEIARRVAGNQEIPVEYSDTVKDIGEDEDGS